MSSKVPFFILYVSFSPFFLVNEFSFENRQLDGLESLKESCILLEATSSPLRCLLHFDVYPSGHSDAWLILAESLDTHMLSIYSSHSHHPTIQLHHLQPLVRMYKNEWSWEMDIVECAHIFGMHMEYCAWLKIGHLTTKSGCL